MSSHHGGSHFTSSHYLSNHYAEIVIIGFTPGGGLDELPILRGAHREEEELMLLLTMFVAYIENDR